MIIEGRAKVTDPESHVYLIRELNLCKGLVVVLECMLRHPVSQAVLLSDSSILLSTHLE